MKLLLLLAAREGVAEALKSAVSTEAQRLAAAPSVRVTALLQVDGDSFALANPSMREFEATIEVIGDDLDAASLVTLADGIASRLEPVVHADLSAVLVGEDSVVISSAPTPTRFQYCMRRKAGTTHEQYLDHYVNRHAHFGLITPGIDGYVQFHVDLAASADAAQQLGFGVHSYDSVSELHMQSLGGFLAALEKQNPGDEALKDEQRFVDRHSSGGFTSDVIWRSWSAP